MRTRTLRRPKVASVAPIAKSPLFLLLTFLTEDEFTGVFDALALVRLRLAIAPDLGGNLADSCLVIAADDDLGRLGAGNLNAFRDRVQHVMAVAELELELLALQRRAIADAGDLQ